jgi:hypothetical protein
MKSMIEKEKLTSREKMFAPLSFPLSLIAPTCSLVKIKVQYNQAHSFDIAVRVMGRKFL